MAFVTSCPVYEEMAEKIGLNAEYEEYAIHDYELPFPVDEYTSIEEINRLCEMVNELPDEIQEELSELVGCVGSLEELYEKADQIFYYPDCETMADFAECYLEETGILESIPSELRNYIDYEAYGRDLSFSGTFVETNHGICEIAF